VKGVSSDKGGVGRGRVVLVGAIGDSLRRDVVRLLAADGWRPVDREADGTELRVVDQPAPATSPHAVRSVLVCAPTSFAAVGGVRAVHARLAGGVVARDELAKLSMVLDLLDAGGVAMSGDLLDRAERQPLLGERQRAVLTRRLAGMTNDEIARTTNLSVATVKRTMRGLYKVFQVGASAELVVVATRFGFEAHCVSSGES
jgi:DNA-binding CsgD family transcriptional regulator